jgi:chaperonin GroES
MEIKKLKPLGNRIVVQRSEAKTSKGGIILPDSAQEKPRQGKIVAVGSGKVDDKGRVQPMSVKVGDEVLFSSYSGTEFQDDYLIISEEDLLAVLA